jgi:hypothetical protein
MKNLSSKKAMMKSKLSMGAPVALFEVPSESIANTKVLDGIDKVTWIEPMVEKPTGGVWVLGSDPLSPISIVDTDGEGLIAFDTGDSKFGWEMSGAVTAGMIGA